MVITNRLFFINLLAGTGATNVDAEPSPRRDRGQRLTGFRSRNSRLGRLKLRRRSREGGKRARAVRDLDFAYPPPRNGRLNNGAVVSRADQDVHACSEAAPYPAGCRIIRMSPQAWNNAASRAPLAAPLSEPTAGLLSRARRLSRSGSRGPSIRAPQGGRIGVVSDKIAW
jgi:hypothetical protein